MVEEHAIFGVLFVIFWFIGIPLFSFLLKRNCLNCVEEQKLVAIRGGKGKKNGYHIQHINSYHSRLKTFMDSFKGVSTKYFGNYIVWHNLVNYAPETEDEKAQIMFGFVTTYPMKETNDELSHRPIVPVL